jgi:hypothetical protein
MDQWGRRHYLLSAVSQIQLMQSRNYPFRKSADQLCLEHRRFRTSGVQYCSGAVRYTVSNTQRVLDSVDKIRLCGPNSELLKLTLSLLKEHYMKENYKALTPHKLVKQHNIFNLLELKIASALSQTPLIFLLFQISQQIWN